MWRRLVLGYQLFAAMYHTYPQVSSSPNLALEDGTCPKKSVTFYQSLPCNSPEEQRLPVHLLGSLISCFINASSGKFSDSKLVFEVHTVLFLVVTPGVRAMRAQKLHLPLK
jgi:hypothetical protein